MSGELVKVLLVEDDEDDFIIARRLLDEVVGRRYLVDWVPDFDAAQQALANLAYDVCLVDYHLGARDGIQFIRKAVEASCRCPLILLTGQADHQVDLQGMEAGAADFLIKNQISAGVLERAIRYSIQRKRNEDALRQMQRALANRVQERTAELEAANEALQNEISERRQAEAQLRRSERNLADFFDNAAVGLHWASRDGTILRANQAELDLVGYPREEYVGRHIAEFHVNPTAVNDVFERLAQGGSVAHFEAQLRTKDGTIKNVLITSNVYWEDGKFIHTRSFTRDISERKKAEEALREANRRKDEFLAMLGHELRNPLAAISNAAAVLQIVESSSVEAVQAHHVMDRQIENMTRLLDDLLDVARVTQGKIRLHKEVVDLAETLRRSVASSRSVIEARRHSISVVLPQEQVRIEADATRLDQVLVNLLNNAAKFMEPGGQIRVIVEREGNQAVVRVLDSGIGMAENMLSHAFDLFVQSERSLDRSQGGLGIGLTMVKSLVEMHGGTVAAHSDGLGKGSEFVVRLPMVSRAIETTETTADAESSGPVRRVLVVEDNRDTAGTLAVLLGHWGYTARTAFDGPTAVQAAADFRPEIVLLDIGLPRMDGYEVARRLRSQQFDHKLLLVALTGYGQEDDRRRTAEAGFDHHLLKPVSAAALRSLLANANYGGP